MRWIEEIDALCAERGIDDTELLRLLDTYPQRLADIRAGHATPMSPAICGSYRLLVAALDLDRIAVCHQVEAERQAGAPNPRRPICEEDKRSR